MIQMRLKRFCKLAIFCVEKELTLDFIIRAPKDRCYDQYRGTNKTTIHIPMKRCFKLATFLVRDRGNIKCYALELPNIAMMIYIDLARAKSEAPVTKFTI